MRLFIAEDEAPARARLIETIARVAPGAQVAGTATSLREARAWLAAHPAPDLMLLDIQLADGLSLELFQDGRVTGPTIFVTAFDEFVLSAFQAQAVDYLLKPVDDTRLALAFERHARWQRHFASDDATPLLASLQAPQSTVPAPQPALRCRQRVIGHRGAQSFALAMADVACFISVDKLAHAVMPDGQRYLIDGTLAELEPTLDPGRFFRVSRQVIVAATAIVRFRAAGKGRLLIELRPEAAGELLVSQERAAAFRAWLGQ
jgi:DNA-binding LytR/AlgR family response regulator